MEGVKVVVEPASCLNDEAVSLTVYGLESGQEVTLRASLTDIRGIQYHSYAYYKADHNGIVDVNTMESRGGSYNEVFPMGLISSLSPVLEEQRYIHFRKRDVENSDQVTFSVFRGHLSHDQILDERGRKPLAAANHARHYMAPGVQRIVVRHGRVRGCLFLPPGDGPFPGVVDLYGVEGRLREYRSALLASRGIAALALAYFAHEDLPKTIEEFHISYFEEAVQFLLTHNKVKDDVVHGYEAVDNPLDYPETIIPIEEANAAFLFLVSGDDRNWKSEVYADMAEERLKKVGNNNFTVIKYPEAGHFVEPPFCPFCQIKYSNFVNGFRLFGGRLKPHVEAQVHAWKAILEFIKKHLQTCGVSKGKL